MRKYKKAKQEYFQQNYTAFVTKTPSKNSMVHGKYDQNIFFIPTKASPNPVKRDYNRKNAAYLLAKHQLESNKLAEIEERQTLFLALAAGGKVYDDTLERLASSRELINHPDPTIRKRWLKLGENEFGRLFWGFPPNGEIANGIGVLDWIQKTAVPHDKKVTYPRYIVAH